MNSTDKQQQKLFPALLGSVEAQENNSSVAHDILD